MTGKRWAYEDFVGVGRLELGSSTVDAAAIVEFASEFDPQPFHLDEAVGAAGLLGGLAASGWHTCSIYMRLLYEGLLRDSTSQGAPGVDYVKWPRPVLAGDTLSASAQVLECRESAKRPQIGLVTLRATMVNQRGETVLELQNTGMFLKRSAS